jgi:threonine dehydrogenase-like Zn-dependent dehydrogenase
MGARVVGIASAEVRATAALRVGAHAALSATDPALEARVETEFHGTGTDIVVLTANTWEAWRLSMNIARSGSRVCVLGFPGRAQPLPNFNPLDPAWLYAKGLTILGSGWTPRVECPPADIRFNLRRNLDYILDLMATGALPLETLISHRLPAHRMVEAYELAKAHSKELLAAIFDWRQA